MSSDHQGGISMRKLLMGFVVLLLATATMSQAQEDKPRSYTLVVSGAR